MDPERVTTIVFQPDGITVPAVLVDLQAFRAWVHSARFPEKGRVDWVGGTVEVDVSPEEVNTHGTPKSEIARELGNLVQATDLGVVLIDASRLTCPDADLSCEPDVVVVLFESVEAGRVRLVERVGSDPERHIEIEGAADLVVECVSNSSVHKDTQDLPPRYHRAGVREYWLIDARTDPPTFLLHHRADEDYRVQTPDAEGFARSAVLGMSVRLVRLPARAGLYRFRMDHRA